MSAAVRGCVFYLSLFFVAVGRCADLATRTLLCILLNAFLLSRFTGADDKSLFKPITPDSISLHSINHISVRRLVANGQCNLSYRLFALSHCRTLLLRLDHLDNVSIKVSDGKLVLNVAHVSASCFVASNDDPHWLFLMRPRPLDDSTVADTVPDVESQRVSNKNDVAVEHKQFASLAIEMLSRLRVCVDKCTITHTSDEKALNVDVGDAALFFDHNKHCFIASVANFSASLSTNVTTLAKLYFDEKLTVQISSTLSDVDVAFDSCTAHVQLQLACSFAKALHEWRLQNHTSLTNAAVSEHNNVPSYRSFSHSLSLSPTSPSAFFFRFSLLVCAKVQLQTAAGNSIIFQASQLAVQYDAQKHTHQVCFSVAAIQASIEEHRLQEQVHLKLFAALGSVVYHRNGVWSGDCELTRGAQFQHVCRSESVLCALIDRGLRIYWSNTTKNTITFALADNSAAHLTAEIEAKSLKNCIGFFNRVVRDALDCILPNRLFVPGLAAARKTLHERTDKVAAAWLPKKETCDEAVQPNCLFVCKMTDNCKFLCHLVLIDGASQCDWRLCANRLSLAMFELPRSFEQFCQSMLASSFALDIESLTVQDGVVESHWLNAVQLQTPTLLRIIQKVQYLPTLVVEKKMRIYRRSHAPIEIHANIHEALFAFLKEFCSNASSDSDGRNAGDNISRWHLQIADVNAVISYKPQSIQSQFLGIANVPNLPLTDARLRLHAHVTRADNRTMHSLSSCFGDYIATCAPQLKTLLFAAGTALPIVQPIVQTATDLANDLKDRDRTWSQTFQRTAGNLMYAGAKIGVASYKLAENTDRWLAKKQRRQTQQLALSCPEIAATTSSVPIEDNEAFTDEQDDLPTPSSLVDSIIEDYEPNECRSPPSKPIPIVRRKAKGQRNANPTQTQSCPSMYSNQPSTFGQGYRQSVVICREAAEAAMDAVVFAPIATYKQNNGSLGKSARAAAYGAPRVAAKTVSAIGGTIAKFGHAASNKLDKEKAKARIGKWKS